MRYKFESISLIYLTIISGGKIFAFLNSKSMLVVSFSLSLIGSMVTMLIKHNHCHLPIFKYPAINYILDYWLNILTGTSTSSVKIVHNTNHHDAVNDEFTDWVSTKKFEKKGILKGIVLYTITTPFYTIIQKSKWLSKNKGSNIYYYNLIENLLLLSTFVMLGLINFYSLIMVILLPALVLQFILAFVNYLQHFDTNISNSSNDLLNKWFNRLFFKVGYHNRHHDHPTLHWSMLSEKAT
jgi:fatty acid desaturase